MTETYAWKGFEYDLPHVAEPVPELCILLIVNKGEFMPELVEKIPWGHNTTLIEKIKDPSGRN